MKENKKAFTLAEVLITLSIIGVVAAMTISVITNKVHEKVFNAQFRKAYNTIMNAHNRARYEFGTNPACYYGSGIASNYTDCEEFMKLFLKQLKIAKECGINAMQKGCIPQYKGRDEIGQSSSGCANLHKAYLKTREAYILSDGIIILSGYYDNSRLTTNLIVDINGNKEPNKWGYDVFYLYTYFDGNKYILGSDYSGCVPIENGGRSTNTMLKYVLSH